MKIFKLTESQIKHIINEEYWDATISDEEKQLSKKYEGMNVIWYGNPDQMIVVTKDQVEGMWGNIYDEEKFNELKELILNHEDKIELSCPYAHGGIIEIVNVIEEQRSYQSGSFLVDYDGKDEPASSGDDDLDEYLGIDDISEYDDVALSTDNSELYELLDKYRTEIGTGYKTKDELLNDYQQLEEKEEGDQEAIDAFLTMEQEIVDAIEGERGDIGDFYVQLRDGHHRVMAAFDTYESRVAINLDKEDIQQFKGYYNKI